TSRRMVDLPHPDGPTRATNSPSAIRKLVVESAGTARAPRPKVTEASESSMAIGAAEAGTGEPENSERGCMRIMAGSACKPNASETRTVNQWDAGKPARSNGFVLCNYPVKLHAIEALNRYTIVIRDAIRSPHLRIRRWRLA